MKNDNKVFIDIKMNSDVKAFFPGATSIPESRVEDYTYLFIFKQIYFFFHFLFLSKFIFFPFFPDCEFLSTEDSWFVPGVSGRIQRADVARYMLKVVEEDLHHKKIVAISPK